MVSEWGEMKPSAKWTLIQEKTNPRSKHSLTMPYLDLLCIFSWNVQRSPGKVFPLIPVHAPRQGVQLENVKGLLTETMTRNAKKWKNRKNETSQNITRLYKIASWFFYQCSDVHQFLLEIFMIFLSWWPVRCRWPHWAPIASVPEQRNISGVKGVRKLQKKMMKNTWVPTELIKLWDLYQ